MTPAGVDQLVRAGVLENPLAISGVEHLASRPQLQVTSGELTVLRAKARQPADPRLWPEDPRPYVGFHAEHSDRELDETTLRWWRSDPRRVIDNELFACTVSGFVMAVYLITDLAATLVTTARQASHHHYLGQLLGRVHAADPAGRTTGAVPERLRARVELLLRSRVAIRAGNSIAYAERSIDAHGATSTVSS